MSLTKENPRLRKAIDAAPPQEIYCMLYHICATEPATAKAFESRLVVTVDGTGSKCEDTNDDKENTSPGEKRKRDVKDRPQTRAMKKAKSGGTSRCSLKEVSGNTEHMRTRWGKCRRCNEKYEVLHNEEGDCVYHPVEEEFDPDIGSGYWAGMHQWEDISEEDQHRWTCCNEIGSAEGCKTGRHKELNGEGPENESSEEDDEEEESGEESDGD